MVLNIAEGAGEFSPAEKARFYRIARRSAAECCAALDLAEITGTPLKQDLADVQAMLTTLVKAHERRR